MKTQKRSLSTIAFLQASGLVLYCSLIGILFWKGNTLFGKMPNYIGPVLFLVLFVTSALVSALITLGYPIILFWEKKQTKEAIRLVAKTTLWLGSYILLFLGIILARKLFL